MVAGSPDRRYQALLIRSGSVFYSNEVSKSSKVAVRGTRLSEQVHGASERQPRVLRIVGYREARPGTALDTAKTRMEIQTVDCNIKKTRVMDKTDANKEERGAGGDFIRGQRAVDDAINERLKSETGKEKIDPRKADDVEHKPDHSQKKTGRTKH